MPKIVHLGKYFYPDQGGIENVTLNLARGASLAGHNVTVVCFASDAIGGSTIYDGVRVLKSSASSLIASQPVGFRYLVDFYKSAWKADLVHLHMPNMLAAFCAILMPPKVRLLVHWHSDVINKGWLGRLFYPLQYLLLYKADAIVATSPSYVDASILLANFREKITVIPIGIDARRPAQKYICLPDKLSTFIGSKKIILAIGRLVPYKGFEFLILSANYLSPEARVVIVGDGPMRSNLESIINDSYLEDRVILAGRLSDDQINSLLYKSSIYCMSSINKAEAFGVVMLEALSCGVPIVATDISGSGVPWVNKHGLSGLIVPAEDPKAMAQACNQILSSERLRSQLSNGAKQRFSDEFTADLSISRILNLYSELLE